MDTAELGSFAQAWADAVNAKRATTSTCNQCGQPWDALACGPTHQVIATAPAPTPPER